MKELVYEAPQVEIVEVAVEKGYTLSSISLYNEDGTEADDSYIY